MPCPIPAGAIPHTRRRFPRKKCCARASPRTEDAAADARFVRSHCIRDGVSLPEARIRTSGGGKTGRAHSARKALQGGHRISDVGGPSANMWGDAARPNPANACAQAVLRRAPVRHFPSIRKSRRACCGPCRRCPEYKACASQAGCASTCS